MPSDEVAIAVMQTQSAAVASAARHRISDPEMRRELFGFENAIGKCESTDVIAVLDQYAPRFLPADDPLVGRHDSETMAGVYGALMVHAAILRYYSKSRTPVSWAAEQTLLTPRKAAQALAQCMEDVAIDPVVAVEALQDVDPAVQPPMQMVPPKSGNQ
jgi:hypothetical protein